MTAKPKIGAIAPWYGGNRMLAENVGRALDGCEWVGIPFAGGMAEIAHIRARTIVANDLHRGLVNFCVVLNAVGAEELQRSLRCIPFHPDSLGFAQTICDEMNRGGFDYSQPATEASERWALNWFIAVWMTRSGLAGTDGELGGNLALRWTASGGDSAKRYQSAIDSLAFWAEEFRRCTFSTHDAFEFLGKCIDRERCGIYCDPPFPDDGKKYKHKFSEDDHRRLAVELAKYRRTRIVCRFYEHPLIRQLYCGPGWTWLEFEGRNQANKASAERLIVRNVEATP